MRLIDADALLEDIVHLNNVYVQGRMAYIIDNQPTAYDVEAVVAELEKSATDDDGLFVSDGSEPMIWKSKAIEIVRNGKEQK